MQLKRKNGIFLSAVFCDETDGRFAFRFLMCLSEGGAEGKQRCIESAHIRRIGEGRLLRESVFPCLCVRMCARVRVPAKNKEIGFILCRG